MKSPSRLFAVCLATACLGAGLAASSASALPAPAWSPIAHSGPTNLPPVQDEIQRISVDAEDGTYTLTHQFAKGTGTLSFASAGGFYAENVDTILACQPSGTFAEGQTVEGPGIAPNTTITAPPSAASCGFLGPGVSLTISTKTTAASGGLAPISAASKEVTDVSTDSGAFAPGQDISGDGIPAGTTITEVDEGAETLTLSALPTEGGEKALTATGTTDPIAFNATASEVEAALEALGLEVSVTGGPGGKGGTDLYAVSFEGDLAGKDVAQLSADSGELTGGDNHIVTVTTAIGGGPGTSEIVIYVQNIGGVPSKTASEGQPTFVKFKLPTGVTTAG